MPHGNQQSLIDQLRPTLSSDRIGTYLTASGFDEQRALKLYIWNAHIGEAFHVAIQGAEVGLRNRIDSGFSTVFGPEWWQNPAFLRNLDHEGAKDIETAKKRIRNRGSTLSTGQMIATLSFGFWVGALQPRFNPPVWASHLRTSFPDLPPSNSRYDLAAEAKRVRDLRNRIWHHEPIFRMNLSDEHASVMRLLTWVCPIKAGWIRPLCRVPQLLRQKP